MKWLSLCTMGLSELMFTWISQEKEERGKLHNPTNISFHTLTTSLKIKVSYLWEFTQAGFTCLGPAQHFFLSQMLAGNADPGAGQADGQGLHQALLLHQPSCRAGMFCLPFMPVQSESALLDFFLLGSTSRETSHGLLHAMGGKSLVPPDLNCSSPCHQHGLISTQTIQHSWEDFMASSSCVQDSIFH